MMISCFLVYPYRTCFADRAIVAPMRESQAACPGSPGLILDNESNNLFAMTAFIINQVHSLARLGTMRSLRLGGPQ
jgi:hypothetical protein